MLYSFVVALLSGLVAGVAATKLISSKWSYVVALLGAAVVAVLINVGILQAMASFFLNAPFDASAGLVAAGHSFWLSLIMSCIVTWAIKRRTA
jgi:hypothetical protein